MAKSNLKGIYEYPFSGTHAYEEDISKIYSRNPNSVVFMREKDSVNESLHFQVRLLGSTRYYLLTVLVLLQNI